MRAFEAVVGTLGALVFLGGLIFACLPSAVVRKLTARLFRGSKR